MSPEPMYEVGQEVQVEHSDGMKWCGKILWRSLPDDTWEYEVENAPRRRLVSDFPTARGYEWHPLVWEFEIKGVV